jgi:NADPH:quinone reductase-like Zn-dependent oxidoreductase
VTAVCDSKHVELVSGLGADRVIDYTAEDFTRDTQAYDVVLDAVGKSSFGRCKRLLKPRGIYLSSDLGPLSQNSILALITPLLHGKKVLTIDGLGRWACVRDRGCLLNDGIALRPRRSTPPC